MLVSWTGNEASYLGTMSFHRPRLPQAKDGEQERLHQGMSHTSEVSGNGYHTEIKDKHNDSRRGERETNLRSGKTDGEEENSLGSSLPYNL